MLEADETKKMTLVKGVPYYFKIPIATMKPPLTFYFKFLKGAENAHINVHGSFSQQYPHEKQNNVNAAG